jgi:hypothetical protein
MGLQVVVRAEPRALLTAETALAPDEIVDVAATDAASPTIAALVWRAIAHGARAVAFDPGRVRGGGVTMAGGGAPDWVAPVRSLAQQLQFNGTLVASLARGPAVRIVAPVPAGLDVMLLQDAQSWILIATHTGAAEARVVVHLPPQVPAALWSNLLEGGGMSMLVRPEGPQWTLTVPAGAAKVYVIDKHLREKEQERRTFSTYFTISSTVSTLTGPRLAARMGCSILARSPTTTIANLSVCRYCAAARWTSAAVTAWIFGT